MVLRCVAPPSAWLYAVRRAAVPGSPECLRFVLLNTSFYLCLPYCSLKLIQVRGSTRLPGGSPSLLCLLVFELCLRPCH